MKYQKLPTIEKKNIYRKEFSYSMSGTSLTFTLRTDIKTELSNFRICLQEALKDVDEELSK